MRGSDLGGRAAECCIDDDKADTEGASGSRVALDCACAETVLNATVKIATVVLLSIPVALFRVPHARISGYQKK